MNEREEEELYNKVVLGGQKPSVPGNLIDNLLQQIQIFNKMLEASKIAEINSRLSALESR